MFTGRRRDDIWKYYSEVSPDENGLKSKSKRAKCKRCNTEMTALVARMKNHYYNTCRGYSGHAWRSQNPLLHVVLTENPKGKRPLGRPRLRWEDLVKRDVESLNGGPDWKTKAADRDLEDWLTKCKTEEKVNTTDTEIKIEKNVGDGNNFEGTVFSQSHSSKLINHVNLDKKSTEREFICDKSFHIKSQARKHIQSVCNKTLKVHTRTQTGVKPFRCDMCKRTFSTSSSLNVHGKTHTGEKPFKCNICSQTFSQSATLKNHTRKHTGEKPFRCGICNLTFSQSTTLKVHSRTHTGEKPFKCDICSKTFSQSAALKVHTRKHTGEKPFKSGICNRTFSCASHLKYHTTTRTGDKPFRCDICSQTFSQSTTLKAHTRTHTGEKPFKCDICGAAFSQSFSLTVYKRKHTKEMPFKCGICNRTFSYATHFRYHTMTHTG
eukprot:XP_008184319.1 PREDICTED: zinc finger protein 664-like [Acyrthosiphon pisum]